MIKKSVKKEWHAPNTKFGMGDYYGTGVKQKVGRVRDVTGVTPIKSKDLGKPPKSLA